MSSNRNRTKDKPQATRRSPLPLVLMAGGLVLIIAVLAMNLSSGGSGAPNLEVKDVQVTPDASVQDLKVDFGEMKLGAEDATVTVSLTNTGEGVLRFKEEPYVELAAGC